jgi:hypothetical protein
MTDNGLPFDSRRPLPSVAELARGWEHIDIHASAQWKGQMGPFGYTGMGGMFTVVKVRNERSNDNDPGWYEHPEGTVSRLATPQELQRDGLKV